MKLRLDFSFFNFNYNAPIQVNNNLLNSNQALSVKIYEDNLLIKKIDFTTLFNFHNYNLMEWKNTIELFFDTEKIIFNNIVLDLPYFNMIKSNTSFKGELLFAIESILFALIEKKSPAALSHIKKTPIKLNALYSPDLALENIPECLKIKIRPTQSNLIKTIELMNFLAAKNRDIIFRLDGNQSFELLDLNNYLKEIKIKNVLYLEEPLKNFNDLFSFKKFTNFAYAMDESLVSYLDNIKQIPENNFLILKPSLLGISKCFEIINIKKKNIVISSTYETNSAITPHMYLAASLPCAYHGLDTLKFLPEHLSIKNANYSLTF